MRKVGPDITVGRSGAVVFAAALAVVGTTTGAGVPNAAPRCERRAVGDDPGRLRRRAYGTSPTDNSQTLATPAFVDAINADPT